VAQRADTSVVRLGVPQSVGPWVFAGRHDYPDPALGVLVRYQRPDSLRVDVFAYPGPDLASRCPLACAKDVLAREINDFVGAFPEMIKRQYVDTVFVVSDKTLSPAADNAWQLGRHLVLGVVSKGTAERSDFYLYYLRGFRIKLRASYVADSSRVHGVEEFAQMVVPAMWMRPPVAQRDSDGASTERPISVSVTVSGHQPDVFRRLAGAVVQQGYTIADSSTTDGRIVTAPLVGWPKGTETKAWHGKDSPGVVLYITAHASGDSTTIEIGSRSPTVAAWRDAKIANQLQVISVILFAGAVREVEQKAP
jgi:hypothetical protein